TGGVGDKVTLALAPAAAACGIRVPMICGRGLGHTGGTTDKLEAIPGFRTTLSPAAFRAQVRKLGLAIVGPNAALAPADGALYALRDVSGTVESIPLITSSILSKKLAAGIDGLVLDVKVGLGAFMQTEEDARDLASSLVRVGRAAGLSISAVLTAMDAPLGQAIGNALETAEAFEILLGRGPEDVRELVVTLGAEMLRLGRLEPRAAAARKRIEGALEDGSALRMMERLVKAQGGDPRVVAEPDRLERAPHRLVVPCETSGAIASVDSKALGLASVALGAGRARKEDIIDPAVGLLVRVRPGERVREGAPLAEIHARTAAEAAEAREAVRRAFTIARRAPAVRPLVIDVVRR
ncbi:MAG: thymidine phosphorylase, partial [Polyangiaceae bacterium]|nr:thymidine phosphorylase [Polyangiaceae bacterium]